MKRIFRFIKRKWSWFLINKVYAGTKPKYFEKKRKLLLGLGYEIGEDAKIVGPIFCTGKFRIGNHCWIGKNFTVNGNGTVVIGDNCDIGPEVIFQTGGHEIGDACRRAGKGKIFNQFVGNGTWIGGRSTICNDTKIGNGCVVAGCACVCRDIEDNSLVGGVPARLIRKLKD